MTDKEQFKNSRVEKSDILNTFDLFRIFFRSFFIQGTFTLMEKFGVGFGFVLIPGIKRIARNPVQTKQILKRHSGYFNTHPYLSSFILGSVLHLEERALDSATIPTGDIENLKNRLAGTLGSLGDRLFWKYLKPFASITALVLLFTLHDWYPWNILTSLICFLFIFNIFHLYYRWWGIQQGYKSGTSVIRSKSILYIERLNFLIASFSLGLLGMLIILEGRLAYEGNLAGVVIFITAAGTAFYLNYRKISPSLSITVGMGASLIVYALFQLTGT